MIQGSNINLRVVQSDDLAALFPLENDLVRRGDFYPLHLWSERNFRRQFEETGFWTDTFGALLIVDKAGEILGKISYFQTAQYMDSLEIAYILFAADRRGQGVMSEALALMVEFLFKTKKINRLQLTVIPGNEASARVAEKCGFQREGVLRQAIFHHGRRLDLVLFSLLREETPWL